MTTDFSDLVPELSKWNEGQGIDIEGWICCVGSYEHLIGYMELLWPTFVEHDGCILRVGFSEQSYKGFMKQTGGDKKSVEIVINHIHILDIFGNTDIVPTLEQVLHIGRKLKEIWACKLSSDFPGRQFVVSFPEDPTDDLINYEITFFQEPNQPAV